MSRGKTGEDTSKGSLSLFLNATKCVPSTFFMKRQDDSFKQARMKKKIKMAKCNPVPFRKFGTLRFNFIVCHWWKVSAFISLTGTATMNRREPRRLM